MNMKEALENDGVPDWPDDHNITEHDETQTNADFFKQEVQRERSSILEHDVRMRNINRHPLLAPNAPFLSSSISIPLDVPGYDGYTLTTPRSSDTSFGDDWELMNLLAGAFGHSPDNIKKPYTRENIKKSLAEVNSFQNSLWTSRTMQARHEALFDFRHPLKRSIPLQMIRHNDILIGHCVLTPGKKPKGTNHITQGYNYVKLCFFLSSNHRRKGVLFAALKVFLTLAAVDFGADMVYAKAETSNTAATSLLYKLMDWSELQFGGVGTTSDSTIRIEHRDLLSGDIVPGEMEIRPATQYAWPISLHQLVCREMFPNSCKPLHKYELTTWHGEWKKSYDLKHPDLEECMVDAVRNRVWDPANVINDASFGQDLASKSAKREETLPVGIRTSGRERKESARKKEASMND